jgi:outer membrane protein assembly factor BamB
MLTVATTIIALLLSGVALASVATSDEDDAKILLSFANGDAGLCLHLGAGKKNSPGLTAALGKQSRMLVHGLAADEESFVRASDAVAKAGVAGQVMVERVAIKPLPYLNDIANLVVVEDLTALGLDENEVLRVVAPGGALCVRTGNQWVKKVKARPAGMDDWTHLRHGADGNVVSKDSALEFPLGIRWSDGIPVALGHVAATRAMVAAGGRCFALTINVPENIGKPAGIGRDGSSYTEYVVARDAFNGLPLWKFCCGTDYDALSIGPSQTAPLAADDELVFTHQEKHVVALEARTGKVLWKLELPHKVVTQVAYVGDVLLASCWAEKQYIKGSYRLLPKGDTGTLEAFDKKTGTRRWSAPGVIMNFVVVGDSIYTTQQTAGGDNFIAALDLNSGNEHWRKGKDEFGGDTMAELQAAGSGFAIVWGRKPQECRVLSAKDGSTILTIPTKLNFAPIVEQEIWLGGKKYDPLTGQVKGKAISIAAHHPCQPTSLTSRYHVRWGEFKPLVNGDEKGVKSFNLASARSACVQGAMVANGMYYNPQTNCKCVPGTVVGFVGIGPTDLKLTPEDFSRPRPVEKGPAIGTLTPPVQAPDDWPYYRHDAERSAASPINLAEDVKMLWQVEVSPLDRGAMTATWDGDVIDRITAPVCAGGVVYLARVDQGQVCALDAINGASRWMFQAASRIDTPPTIYRGLCLFGCNDGWLYAVRATDGKLAWRSRVAPLERRMVVTGQVESLWPVIGSVVAQHDLVYAAAGRSTEADGGIAVAAFSVADGTSKWGTVFGPATERLNDMLRIVDNLLLWHHRKMDPATGAIVNAQEQAPKVDYFNGACAPMIDNSWTVLHNKRGSNAFKLDKITANVMAWNEKMIVQPAGAVSRDGSKLWDFNSPRALQVEAISIGTNVAVLAGRVRQRGTEENAFLWVVCLKDGKKTVELPLPAPVVYNGIALAHGKVFIALQNGRLICLGK